MNIRYSFIFIITLLLVFSFQPSYAQTVYGSNQYIDAGNPGGLNTESDAPGQGSWTTIIAGPQSSNVWSPVQTMPFSFHFFGNSVTHYMVSQNGLVTFDTSATLLPNDNRNLPTDSLPNNTIACYWDQFTPTPPTGSGDDVRINVFGTAPNRQLWIKWYSFEYGGLSYAYNAVVLEETTNSIYLVDLYSATTPALTGTAGIQMDNSTAYQFGDSLIALAGNGSSNTDNDYIEFVILTGNDAGVASIDTPATPYCGSSGLWVTIENFGSNTLTSATVNWTLNAVAQTPYNWTGSVPSGGTDGPFMISSTSFVQDDSIAAWTSMPNGVADENPLNDTLSTIVEAGLAGGTYTIGGIGADYATFTDAANALNSLGICGPVTFNVDAASGPYIEQIELGEITGTSATNTITFNGNGATLRWGSTDTDNRHVLRLNGADYVTFNNMVIEVDPDSTYGWGVHLINAADHNTFNNVTVNGDTASTSTNYLGIVATGSNTSYSTAGNNANYLVIDNCTVIGGYYGIRLNGNSGGLDAVNNTIMNSTIQDFRYYAIYLDDTDGALVSGNDISRPNRTSVASFYGTYLTSGNINCTIEKNYYHNPFGSAPGSTSLAYVIYFSGADAPVGQENVVKNNVIYDINTDGTIYGIYNSGSDGAYYYNNTISIDYPSTAGTTRGFYQSSAADNIDFRNNVLTVTRGGTGTKHALYFNTTTSTITSDNNAIWVNPDVTFGYFGGTDYATYTDWRTANGGAYDSLSVNADPAYTDLAGGDLTPTSGAVNDIGAPLAEVTEDILGNPRPSTPDPGAYEFTPAATDVAVSQFLNLPNQVLPNTVVNFDIEIANIGATSVPADTVDVFLNGVLSSSHEYTALAPTEYDTVSASITASSTGPDTITAALRTVSGDGNLANDTLEVSLTIETIYTAPYSQNFDGIDPTVTGAVPPGWTNETDDDFDWDADNNGTTSTGTGPAHDHTTGSTGNYMYTEATGPSAGDVANLTTPPIVISGLTTPTLQFWFHMYGADMGELHVDVWSGGVWTNDVRAPLVGQYQTLDTDPWLSAFADLSSFSSPIKVRFRGIIGASFTSDMAIDDILIGEPSLDMAVTNFIDLPVSPLGGTTIDVDVEVSNVGGLASGTATLDLYLNGVFSSSATVAALAIGESDTVTASVTTSASGTDTLTAALQMVPGDIDLSNDTLTTTYTVSTPMATPYFQDFEAGGALPMGWTNETDDDFDWTADAGGTTSSGTGPAVDHTLGTTAGYYMYTEASSPRVPGDEAHLTTPYVDLTGLTDPALQFWFHMYGADMGELHVDVWSGGVWTLDAMPPLIGQYQTANADPWLRTQVNLAAWAGSIVKVRFRGIIGASFYSDMAIDDVNLGEAVSDIQARKVDKPKLTMIAQTQTGITSNIGLYGVFSNLGPINTGDVNVDVTNTTSVYTNSLTGVTINAFSDSTFAVGSWNASSEAAGSYNINMYSSNFTDTDASNDTTKSSVILGNQMAFDNGVQSTSGTFVANIRSWFAVRYSLTDDDTLTSVSILVTEYTLDTDSFAVELWSTSNDTPSTPIATIFEGTYGQLGTRPVLAQFLVSGIPLTAGDYAVVFDMRQQNNPGGSYPCGVDFTAQGAQNVPRTFWGKYETSPWLVFEDVGAATWTPIIRAGFQEITHNFAVDSLMIQACLAVDDTVTVSARVTNKGNQSETNIPIELRENGVLLSSTPVSLNVGESSSVSFSYTPSDTGIVLVEVASQLPSDVDATNDTASAYIRVAESGTQILFTDDFEDPTFTFANWIIVDDPTSTNTWLIFSPPYPNAYTLPITSRKNVFSADADEAGSGSITITTAMLPLDLSSYDSLHLDFDNDWNAIDAQDTARVKVSNDSGATWTTLIEWVGSGDVRNTHETLDLTPYLANSANAIIAFESIQPGFDWWWTIDNVCVSAVVTCTPGFLGDITGDDLVNSTDALVALSYDAGLTIPQAYIDRINIGFGDVNGDAITNSTDALVLLSYDAGISTPFPVGDPVCLPDGNKRSASTKAVVPEKGKNVIVSAAPAGQVTSGSTFEVPVMVNVSKTGELLGSYTATLEWNPDVFEFVGYSGGNAKGFENPVVNDKAVAEGRLTFAHAYPFGAEGDVNIFNVRMKSIGKEGTAGSLSLHFSAMAAAKTFTNLLPYVVNAKEAVTVDKFAYGLGNYPNPFNPSTDIRYSLAEAGNVQIVIYNVLGQKVNTLVDGRKEAGNYVIRWNGTNEYGQSLPSGMYFLHMQAGKFRADRKLLFLK